MIDSRRRLGGGRGYDAVLGAAEHLFGWIRTEAIGRIVADLIVPERFRRAHNEGVRRYLMTGQGPVLGKPVETKAARKDGTEVHIELTRWALEDSDEPEFYAFIRDVTARVEAEFAATHDALTGLANMSLLVRDAERRFAERVGDEYRPTLILLDIDRFKRVNDEFGRAMGDDVLRQLARRFKDIARSVPAARTVAARSGPGKDPRGGQRLIIEVTESVLIDRPDAVAAALAGLRGLGAAVAIDDFGTGFSSLAYLKELPFNVIKVDKSFVDGLPDSRPDRAIVISTIELAHELGFAVVAEGVETTAQRDALLLYGADFAQGFLLVRPRPAVEIERLLGRAGAQV